MMFCRKFIIFLICFSAVFFAHADEVADSIFDMEKLSLFFDHYKRKQAFNYASQYLSEQEGDPYFDYYYGVSAIDSGFASKGVFALERVLLVFPEDSVTRLELARGYFVLKEYARSRQEFEAVLSTSPPESVKRTAYLYLDKIRLEESRYKTTVSGFAEVGAGYDSNVNSAPGNTFNGFLTPSSIEQGDNFYNLAAQVQVVYPFLPGWRANVSATGLLKKNQDLNKFDTATGILQTGLSLTSEASLYTIDLVAQEFQLDGDNYRRLLGVNTGWRYDINELSNFSTSLQFANLKYDIFPILDSNLYSLNVGYTEQFSVPTTPVFFSNIKIGKEDAKSGRAAAQSDTDRDIYSLNLGLTLSLSTKFLIQAAAGVQNSQYTGNNALLNNNDKRKDNFVSANLNFLWLINYKWRLETRISYVDNRSNIELREYDRTMTSVNLNYNY